VPAGRRADAHPPLRLRPRRSRYLLLALSAITLAAGLTVVGLDLPFWQRAALAALVLGLFIHELRRHYLRRGHYAVVSASWSGERGWSITTGVEQNATLLPGSLCHPLLVILVFRASGWRRYPLVLPADGLDADTARRLRRLLKAMARGGQQGPQSAAPGGT